MTIPSSELHFPPLESARLLLRPISSSDAAFVVKHFLDPAVQQYLYDEEPFTTPEQALAIIDFYTATPNCDYNRWLLVRRADLQPIGTCGFHKWSRQHHRAEIGYDLSPAYQGAGYMLEAVHAMLAHGFNTLGLERIEALVAVANTRSRTLLERLSFQHEGTLRKYFWSRGQAHDHHLFARLRTEPSPHDH